MKQYEKDKLVRIIKEIADLLAQDQPKYYIAMALYDLSESIERMECGK